MNVNLIGRLELDEHAGLVSLATEHDGGQNTTLIVKDSVRENSCSILFNDLLRTAHEDIFHRSWDSLFSRCVYKDIIYAADSVRDVVD